MLDKFRTPQLFDRTRIDVIRHRSRGLLVTTASHGRRWLAEYATVVRQWLAAVADRTPLTGLLASGRGRGLLAAATALVFITGGALAANATVGDPAPAPAGHAAAPADSALEDRDDAADTPDRGERPDDGPTDGGSQATEPQESPRPEPEPEAEAEAEAEPAQAEAEAAQAEEATADWVHPMPGTSTTSCFGWRWGAQHAGVDLAGPHGTPIQAVGSGTVTHAGWAFGGYGISVVIDHHDGHYTHYAHASEAKVSVGDTVSPGQVIALEGSTGDSTGPHLHFEVHKGGLWNQVEPTAWMANRGVSIGGC